VSHNIQLSPTIKNHPSKDQEALSTSTAVMYQKMKNPLNGVIILSSFVTGNAGNRCNKISEPTFFKQIT